MGTDPHIGTEHHPLFDDGKGSYLHVFTHLYGIVYPIHRDHPHSFS